MKLIGVMFVKLHYITPIYLCMYYWKIQVIVSYRIFTHSSFFLYSEILIRTLSAPSTPSASPPRSRRSLICRTRWSEKEKSSSQIFANSRWENLENLMKIISDRSCLKWDWFIIRIFSIYFQFNDTLCTCKTNDCNF